MTDEQSKSYNAKTAWEPDPMKLKEILEFQYGHMLDVGENALVMQAASLWLNNHKRVRG